MQVFSWLVLAVFTVAAAQPLGKVTPSPRPAASSPAPEVLYSRKALRRARLLIQMQMWELRDERLECVREAIVRRLPPDLRPTGSPTPAVKQSGAAGATDVRGALRSESEDCGWVSTRRGRRRPAA